MITGKGTGKCRIKPLTLSLMPHRMTKCHMKCANKEEIGHIVQSGNKGV